MHYQPTSRMKLEFEEGTNTPVIYSHHERHGRIMIGQIIRGPYAHLTQRSYSAEELRSLADEMDRLSAPRSVTNPKLLRNKDTGETQPWRGEAVIDRYELVYAEELDDATKQKNAEMWEFLSEKRIGEIRSDSLRALLLPILEKAFSDYREISREVAEG